MKVGKYPESKENIKKPKIYIVVIHKSIKNDKK